MGSLRRARRRPAVEALESRRLFATGLVVEDLPGVESLVDVLALPDGKVLLLGINQPDAEPVSRRLFLARHLADGSPDATFGSSGIAYADGMIPDPATPHANQLAVFPDGSILVRGPVAGSDLAFRRFLPDGTTDAAFGAAGLALFDWGDPATFSPADMTVLPDGRVILSGTVTTAAGSNIGLVRFTPDGQPDPTFDADGRAETDWGAASHGGSVATQPDGKLVVTLRLDADPQATTRPMHVARYNPDGSPDPSFGAGGLATIAVPWRFATSANLAVRSDGRIVVLGTSRDLVPEDNPIVTPLGVDVDLVLAFLSPEGAPDPSFGGGDGLVVDNLGGAEDVYLLELGTDEEIYVGGTLLIPTSAQSVSEFLLVNYTAGGFRDSSFATGGHVVPPLPGVTGGHTTLMAIDYRADGTLFVGATVNDYAVVTHYHANGTADTAFGDDTLDLTPEPVPPPVPPIQPVPPGDPRPPSPLLPVVTAKRSVRKLQIRGTAGDDTIVIQEEIGTGGNVRVTMNGVPTVYDVSRIRRFVVRGLAGNDRVVVTGITTQTVLHGGAGDDHLSPGGFGNDLAFGGRGNDTVFGGQGRDTLFGGPGTDSAERGPDDVVRQVERFLI